MCHVPGSVIMRQAVFLGGVRLRLCVGGGVFVHPSGCHCRIPVLCFVTRIRSVCLLSPSRVRASLVFLPCESS